MLVYDFVDDVRNYFATRVGVPMAGKTLADRIAFNNANAAVEMPFFEQELFELANVARARGRRSASRVFGGMTYNQALRNRPVAGVNGIDKALQDFNLDAIADADRHAGMDDRPSSTAITSMFGTLRPRGDRRLPDRQRARWGSVFGLPLGISFIGRRSASRC